MSEIRSKIYIGLYVNYPLLFSYFNETLISTTDFEKKHSKTKFHENQSSVSRVVPRGQKDRHDEADGPFLQFFERAKNEYKCSNVRYI